VYIATAICFPFIRNFVFEPYVSRLITYISLIITFLLIAYLIYLNQINLWRPSSAWYRYSRFKKFISLLFAPPAIFCFLWTTIAFPTPYIYTKLLGKPSIIIDSVIKDTGYGKRVRYYQLKPRSIDTWFFRFSISENQYRTLSNGEIKARLLVRKSVFGFIVEDIKLENNPH